MGSQEAPPPPEAHTGPLSLPPPLYTHIKIQRVGGGKRAHIRIHGQMNFSHLHTYCGCTHNAHTMVCSPVCVFVSSGWRKTFIRGERWAEAGAVSEPYRYFPADGEKIRTQKSSGHRDLAMNSRFIPPPHTVSCLSWQTHVERKSKKRRGTQA